MAVEQGNPKIVQMFLECPQVDINFKAILDLFHFLIAFLKAYIFI